MRIWTCLLRVILGKKPEMKISLSAPIVLALTLLCSNLTAAAPIDATLFTSYFFDSTHTSLTWIVCGSTANTNGCYSSGGLGPFGKVGTMLEA